MRIRSWMHATLAVALLAAAPGAAYANGVVSANVVADCDGFEVTITAALAYNYQGFLDYSIAVDPAIPGTPIERTIPIAGETANTLVTRTETVAWPAPLTGPVSISGFAHLRNSLILPVPFNGGIPVALECTPERPAIDIEKEISIDGGATWFDADDAASAPSAEAPHGAEYRLTVTNTGNIALTNVLVNDATLGLVNVPIGNLAVGETRVLTSATAGFEALNVPDRCKEAGTVVNVSDVSGVYGLDESEGELFVTDTDPALLKCTEKPAGIEGCTPGYWKQSHHFDSWVGYLPTDSYRTVFGVNSSFNKTLLGALQLGGGGEQALARHAVAALLNTTNGDVEYAYSTAEVIAIVQTAYSSRNFERAKNELARANERKCPLN